MPDACAEDWCELHQRCHCQCWCMPDGDDNCRRCREQFDDEESA